MEPDEVIEASYRWTANESLSSNKWIVRPYYKRLGQGLVKWAIGLLLFAFLFATLIVIFAFYLKSPNTLLSSGFWNDLFEGWMESAIYLAKLLGLFVLVFGLVWINTRYLSPWFQTRRIRQFFSKNPDAEISVHVIIDPEALIWELGDATKITNKWKAYNKVEKSPDGFLFHLEGQHTWIPYHAFKSKQDMEAFGRMAQKYASCYEEII